MKISIDTTDDGWRGVIADLRKAPAPSALAMACIRATLVGAVIELSPAEINILGAEVSKTIITEALTP